MPPSSTEKQQAEIAEEVGDCLVGKENFSGRRFMDVDFANGLCNGVPPSQSTSPAAGGPFIVNSNINSECPPTITLSGRREVGCRDQLCATDPSEPGCRVFVLQTTSGMTSDGTWSTGILVPKCGTPFEGLGQASTNATGVSQQLN